MMTRTTYGRWAWLLLIAGLVGCQRERDMPISDNLSSDSDVLFLGAKAGDERAVAGVELCWCPAGKFTMGSPRGEPERRPGEDQVEVTLTKGFWMAKYETTQGQWKRVVGKLPGPLTAELPEGDDYPVGNVNFAEAEEFCQKLTELGRRSGDLPKDWEFRLPTEAQWEYACRAGTTTATSFGDKISSRQANFKGKPYNGGEPGPSLGKAAKVGRYPANPWGLHDMHGNTCEWCRDWAHAKLPGGVNPDLYLAKDTATKNRTGDISRSRRGSCWADDGWPSRSAFRQRFEPHRRYDHIGFRVVAVRLDDADAELKKLEGAWSLVSEIDDGKEMPAEEAKKVRLTFDRTGNWKVEIEGKRIGEGTAVVDPVKKPKTIDYTFTGDEQKGAKFIAIYELEGDLFQHCGVLKGERPNEFTSKPGSGRSLTVFRREKKE